MKHLQIYINEVKEQNSVKELNNVTMSLENCI